MLTRKKLRTGIIFSLGLALVVMAAIALYGDLPRLIAAIAHFRWAFLPLILGLTLFNYGGRFLKWQYYLKRLTIKLSWRKSLLIFISGLSMAITPGKVGELLKSYLLKHSTGEPVSRTSPIIVSERLTDGVAMIALSSTGLILYRYGWELLAGLLVCVVGGVLVIQNRRLSLALLAFGERLPGISRAAHWLRAFYESSYTLLQWRPLLLAISIGIVSWTGECVALFFVFAGLGLGFGLELFVKSMFIMGISSLIGSASGLPGGLGTADGSMIGLTRLLLTSSATVGGAATLLIRLCTLWFGLALGVVALLVYRAPTHTPIFVQQSDEQASSAKKDSSPSTQESQPDLQAASATSHSGDTLT